MDTGASCSIINFHTFEELKKTQKVELVKSNTNTLAVNGEKLKLLGYVKIKTCFDIEGRYQTELKAWVSAKDGCKPNILGMDFMNNSTKLIDIESPKIELKNFPGVSIALSKYQTKCYPYVSVYKTVKLEHQIHLAPKSTRVVSIKPVSEFFRKGTSFVIASELQDQGVYTYNVHCFKKEKEIPVMLNNPKDSKVIIQKGPIGFTIEDIQLKQRREYEVIDNLAFIETLLKSETDWNQVFHVSEKTTTQILTDNNITKISKEQKNLKRKQKLKEKLYTDTYELETDFSNDLKNLKPTPPKDVKAIRNSQLNETDLSNFSSEDQKFLKKFDFSESEISDQQLLKLANTLTQNKDVYSQHKYDVGKIEQKFHAKLTPNATLSKKRPSRVPLHYQEKLDNLLVELCKAGIIKEMGNDKEMGSEFINPIIILPKGNIVKLVIDARYLNSITDLSRYSWPLEPIGSLLTRLKGNYFTTSDLCSAYNQVPLTEETQQLTSFVIGAKQYTFQRGFYGLCGLPNFFSRIMTIHFAPLIKKKQAITYIDDTIMQSQTINEMFEIIDKYHELLRKAGLKAQPEKTKFFLRKVQFLGHIVGKDGIQPVKKRVTDLKALKSPENKRDVLRVLGCLGFYSMYIKNLHVDCKPFYELAKTETKFEWTAEHENLFNEIKDRISEDTVLAIPDTRYPFHVHVDASSIGVGSILIQEFPEGKRIVSFNSRIYTKEEQKMSTTARELCGVISALQTYEPYIIGSPHPVYVYTDHKPLMYLWGRRGKLSHRFFRYQLVISQFQNLKIIWTEGKNLAFPDILSRNVKLKDLDKHQLKHKKIPKDISFYDKNGNEEKYFIVRDHEKGPADGFYPILKKTINGVEKYALTENRFEKKTYNQNNETICSMSDISESFLQGSSINHYRERNKVYFTELTESENEDNYSELSLEMDEKVEDQLATIENDQILFCELECDDSDIINTINIETEIFDNQDRFDSINKWLSKSNLIKQMPEINNDNADAKQLIEKLTSFAKEVDLNVDVIVQEQFKDPVLQTIRQLVLENNKDTKNIDYRQSKALRSYINKFENICLVGNLLCLKEQTNDPGVELLKICTPLSLFLKVFKLAHEDPLSAHYGIDRTLSSIKRFFFWPGLFKWVNHLIASCLDCQKNKNKRKDLNEAPLEKWTDTVPFPFHTVHIDHKGPLNPPSNGKHHCLVIVDSFSRFLQVYPVRTTSAQDTINALEKFILSFGIPQKLVYDKGTAFMNEDFTNWTNSLGITHAPRTAFSPWTNGKVEIQNKHLNTHFRIFFEQSKGKWSDLAQKFAFAHNTTANTSTGLTPYEIVFGQKPQIPLSLKLGLLRDSKLTCTSEFCRDLPLHRHSLQSSNNMEIDKLLKPKISSSILMRENQFKQIYNSAYKKSLQNNTRAHEHRNKHKLGKEIEVGQQILMENHSIETGKSKKLNELRSGPFTVTRKITNVNYEIELNSNRDVKKVAHRNHLIEYYPAEETVPQLVDEYGIHNDSLQPFYQNLMNSQLNKLNTPLNKFSFKSHENIEFLPTLTLPIDNDNINERCDRTLTNIDSGFTELTTNDNLTVSRFPRTPMAPTNTERARSSTPYPNPNRSVILNPPLSPVHNQSSSRNNNGLSQSQVNDRNRNNNSNENNNRIMPRRDRRLPNRYQAGFT